MDIIYDRNLLQDTKNEFLFKIYNVSDFIIFLLYKLMYKPNVIFFYFQVKLWGSVGG